MENISATVILDAVLIIAFVTAFFTGLSRGLIKSVWKIGTLILTIVLVVALKTPFTNVLAQTDAAKNLYTSVSEKITPIFEDSIYGGEMFVPQVDEIAEVLHLPKIAISQVLNDYDAQAVASGNTSTVTRAIDNISRSISMTILGFIAAVVLFILVKLLLWLIYHILNAVSKLPILNGANKLLGAAIGLINMLFVVYVICAIVSFTAADNAEIYNMICQTYIVKYFYNYNILLQLFMKA